VQQRDERAVPAAALGGRCEHTHGLEAEVTDNIDITTGSHTAAVERFAQLWWEGETSAGEADPAPVSLPTLSASTVVIRAERV
jgi:hypothetical protein